MYTKEEMLNYVDSLAAGVDPLTGEILTSDTVLNRPDVIRMLYSVKDFINSVEIKKSKKVKNKKTSFELKTFDGIIDDDSTISDFVSILFPNSSNGLTSFLGSSSMSKSVHLI